VADKRHDLGVLIGIGAKRSDIGKVFIMMALFLSLVGGLLGWLLGWGFLAALNPFCRITGIQLFPQDVLYTPEAPISWDARVPLFFITIMGVVGWAAAWLPARQASRIDPIAILREGG